MSIRTDSIQHAVDDISNARITGADLNDTDYAAIELDDGTVLRCVETTGGWEAWTDDDRSWPL